MAARNRGLGKQRRPRMNDEPRSPISILRRARDRAKLEIAPQQRRNDEEGDWWRLPTDKTRTASPWRQLAADLTSPAIFSVWHTKIARNRVEWYDRIRPGVTRGILTMVIAASLYAVRLPIPLFLFLAPAAVQASLEIYLHFLLVKLAPDPRQGWAAYMVDVVRTNYESWLVNVTGLIGVVACPINVLLVCFTPAGGEFGWAKVAGLVAAIFFVNSGLTSAFLDPPNYTENSDMPRLMHTVRPYAPLLSLITVGGIIALSVGAGRWETAMVPLAYMSAALTLLLGSTIRNHDRIVAAAIPVARRAILLGRQDMARVAHDTMNSVKSTVNAVAKVDAVPFKLRNSLSTMPAMLTHLLAQAEITDSDKPMPLAFLAEKILADYPGVDITKVSYDLRWADLSEEDHHIAMRVTTALCLNVAQALSKDEFIAAPKEIRLEGFTTGSGRDLRFHLAVDDHLPLIDPWCPPKRSLTALRSLLEREYNGTLEQESTTAAGTKRIVATWSDRAPVAPFGEDFERGLL